MRKHLIISYEFTGKDFRNYVSSFAFSSDATNNDELANEILEAANEHAEAIYKKEYATRNVAIRAIFSVEVEVTHNRRNINVSESFDHRTS